MYKNISCCDFVMMLMQLLVQNDKDHEQAKKGYERLSRLHASGEWQQLPSTYKVLWPDIMCFRLTILMAVRCTRCGAVLTVDSQGPSICVPDISVMTKMMKVTALSCDDYLIIYVCI